MNIIAAVDKNWAIGKNNELLVRIPMDQKFFRETTTGKVVVMGRKTLESFPNGLPLKNRTNIVLTHRREWKPVMRCPAGRSPASKPERRLQSPEYSRR